MMIVAQPCTLAPMTADNPTGPPPKMAIVDPAGHAIDRITPPAPVWIPQPSGPNRCSGALTGALTALRSLASAWLADGDWPKEVADTWPPPTRMPEEASP